MNTQSSSSERFLKTSNLREKVRMHFAMHPESWIWIFSGFIWTLLLWNFLFNVVVDSENGSNMISCLPIDSFNGENFPLQILKKPSFYETVQSQLSGSIFPWVVMVIAMMFPLLLRSIRHTAFSVRKIDRELGVLLFLVGYTFIWSIVGLFYLFLTVVLNVFFATSSFFTTGIAAGIVFLIAAILSWLPSRSIVMIRCELTMPIRISGWRYIKDCLFYGGNIGLACVRMCWVVMLALMLAHHTFLLMLLTSTFVLIERYRVPHESPIPGYGWTIIGSILIINGLFF